MKLKNMIYLAAGLLVLSACETRKEQIYYADDVDAVKISAVVGCDHTKSNPLATGEELRSLSFNDVVCVFTPDLVAEYYKSSAGWNPTDRYYFRWNVDPVTFYAYYPVNKGTGYDKFAVRPNQFSAENLIASDYMTGVAENKYREPVEIVLHRRMAKVTIKIEGLASGQKVQSFKIGSYSVYEEGKPGGSTSITPYVESADIPSGENGTVYTAIVLPGPAASKIPFVTLTYNGSSLKSSGLPEFEQGNAYRYTLTINGSKITFSEPEVSCWSEALPVDDVPEKPGDEPGGDPVEPENPEPPVEPEDPVTPETPTLENAYFVTPTGAGDKSGKSWDNAMSMDELRPLLGSDYGAKSGADCEALDGVTYHFMEGSYCATTSEKDRLKMDFKAYGKACHITFLGGYDQSSTGVDLTKRDIVANETKFTGDRNGNGKADSGDTGIFCLDAWTDLTIDGFTFAHSYGAARWKQKALMINTDVAGAIARANLSNCKFYDLVEFDDSDAKYEGGAAIWICKNSIATIHNCDFTGCKAYSRGGALRSIDATSVFFLNNCAVHDNAFAVSNGLWGAGVQISNGSLLMNNCTIAKNTGWGGALNGGGNWLVVNSTIVHNHASDDASRDMTLRNESSAANNDAVLLNSIVLFDGDKPSIFMNGDDKSLTSKGYNLYGTVGGTTSTFITNSTDKSGQTLSGLGLSWNSAGYYTWGGNVDGFTKAKLSDVENIVKTGCSKATGPFTNLGLDFYNWLQSLENGKNPLALDQAGNARNSAAMWPGAYEKH